MISFRALIMVMLVVLAGAAIWLATLERGLSAPSKSGSKDRAHADAATSNGSEGVGLDVVVTERVNALAEIDPVPPPVDGLEALEAAKVTSKFGRLEQWELSSLLEHVSTLERHCEEQLHGYLSSGGVVGSLQHADYVFDIEGARAKANALITGSYLLLGAAEDALAAISNDPRLHIVQGPGFQRGGRSFATFIVIDMQEQGRFAEAKRSLEQKLNQRD